MFVNDHSPLISCNKVAPMILFNAILTRFPYEFVNTGVHIYSLLPYWFQMLLTWIMWSFDFYILLRLGKDLTSSLTMTRKQERLSVFLFLEQSFTVSKWWLHHVAEKSRYERSFKKCNISAIQVVKGHLEGGCIDENELWKGATR